jgi:hypothetical protein
MLLGDEAGLAIIIEGGDACCGSAATRCDGGASGTDHDRGSIDEAEYRLIRSLAHKARYWVGLLKLGPGKCLHS